MLCGYLHYSEHDDGSNWNKFQLNLPVTPINDLYIQDNDLIAATSGRGFWILDDLGAIQNIKTTKQSLSIFKPKDTYLIFGGSVNRFVPGLGQNPKSGVTFDYYLNQDIDTLTLTLDVLKNGNILRTISSEKVHNFKSWPGGPPKPQTLPAKEGYNRFTWDFNRNALPGIENVFVHGSHVGGSVAPGNYTLRLTLGKVTAETEVTILKDPTVNATAAAYNEQQVMIDQIEAAIREIHESVNSMRSVKTQLQDYAKLLKDNEEANSLLNTGEVLIKKINAWERQLIQPDQKTFQDVINFNNKLSSQLMHLKGYIEAVDPAITAGAKERLSDLINTWNVYQNERDDLMNKDMTSFNAQFSELNLPAIIIKD